MNDNKQRLRRLIIRFPTPIYDVLKFEATAKAIPMAVLVRQLVAGWAMGAQQSARSPTGADVIEGSTDDPQVRDEPVSSNQDHLSRSSAK